MRYKTLNTPKHQHQAIEKSDTDIQPASSITQRSLQLLHKRPHLLERIIQRRRGHTNDARFPLVADDSGVLQPLGDNVQQARFEQQTQLGASRGWVRGGDDLELACVAGGIPEEQILEVRG